jgi:hypothetical protein
MPQTVGALEATSRQCSQCGSSGSLDARFAACAAITHWQKSNYPAPGYTEFNTEDDITLWNIILCEACLPSSYQIYLRDRSAKLKTQLSISVFSFIFAAGVFWANLQFHFLGPAFHENSVAGQIISAPANGMAVATGIVVVLALIYGAISTPVYLMMLVRNQRRLDALRQTGVVPEDQADNSFKGEGLRILAALPSGGSGKVWGDFPLPVHKTREQLDKLPKPPDEKTVTLKERNRCVRQNGNGIGSGGVATEAEATLGTAEYNRQCLRTSRR